MIPALSFSVRNCEPVASTSLLFLYFYLLATAGISSYILFIFVIRQLANNKNYKEIIKEVDIGDTTLWTSRYAFVLVHSVTATRRVTNAISFSLFLFPSSRPSSVP